MWVCSTSTVLCLYFLNTYCTYAVLHFQHTLSKHVTFLFPLKAFVKLSAICTGSSSSHYPFLTESNTQLSLVSALFLCLWMCVCVYTICPCVCVCVFIPAHVLPAPPGAPTGVVHHTGLRTDHPRVVSLSKTHIQFAI